MSDLSDSDKNKTIRDRDTAMYHHVLVNTRSLLRHRVSHHALSSKLVRNLVHCKNHIVKPALITTTTTTSVRGMSSSSNDDNDDSSKTEDSSNIDHNNKNAAANAAGSKRSGGASKKKKPQATFGQLSDDFIGQYYELTTEEEQKYFPEELCGEIWVDKALQEDKIAIMVRKPFLEIKHMMEKLNVDGATLGESEPSHVVVTGDRGVGKSMILNSAVLWARENGWLTMYVPEAESWNNTYKCAYYGTGTMVLYAPSKLYPGMFAQPLGAQKMLQQIKAFDEEKLRKLPKKREYSHKGYERDEGLMGIVERGLQSIQYAADALYDLRMEYSLVTEHPVLIAVDQVNALYWPTPFYLNAEPLSPNKMQLMETFRDLDHEGKVKDGYKLKRGLSVMVGSGKFGASMVTTKHIQESEGFYGDKHVFFKPWNRYGDQYEVSPEESMKRGVKLVDVPVFTRHEIRMAIIQWKRAKMVDSNTVGKDLLNTHIVEAIRTATNGNARELREAIRTNYHFCGNEEDTIF